MAVASAGCGGDDDVELPEHAVAKVAGVVITKSEFKRRVREERASEALSEDNPIAYDPPAYRACVAVKRKRAGDAKDAEKRSEANLKKACELEHRKLRDSALQSLIRAEWIRQGAERQGIEISEKVVRRAAQQSKEDRFSNEKAYRRYLSAANMTGRDFLSQVLVDELGTKLTEELARGVPAPSDRDIRSYYRRHKKDFRVSERRFVRVLIAKTRAEANQGKAALKGGRSWKSVVEQYSSVPWVTELQGRGVLEWVNNGEPMASAIFRARKDQIVGPIKVSEGWQVSEMERIKPPSFRPLPEVRADIRHLVQTRAQNEAVIDFAERYKERTICAAGYKISDCSNTPKEKPAPPR